MSRQSIYHFFKVNSSLFKQNFFDATKLANPDSIHDLRVSVKRLNALVKVLNYGKTSNFRIKNNYPHLKLVFKAAAPVRDFQVLEALLSQYHQYKDLHVEELSNHVRKFSHDAIKEFFLNSKKFDSLAISRLFGIIENHINNLNELDLENHFNSFKSNHLFLLTLYSNPLSDKYNLHSARKIIKDLAYLIEMSEPVLSDSTNQLPVYKEAGRFLGEWHDRLVLLNFLNQKSEILQIKNGSIKNMIQLITDEKDTLKEQYFTSLKSIDSN